jgi:hypothetical protein
MRFVVFARVGPPVVIRKHRESQLPAAGLLEMVKPVAHLPQSCFRVFRAAFGEMDHGLF